MRGFVRPSVRRSVRPSVRWSVGEHESKSVKTRISAPAHPFATGMAVYPALLNLRLLSLITFVCGLRRDVHLFRFPELLETAARTSMKRGKS